MSGFDARRPPLPPPRELRVQRVPLPDVGGIIAGAVVSTVRHHPIPVALNFLGLAVLFLASGYTPSDGALQRYEAALPSGDLLTREQKAATAAARSRAEYASSRGWFFTCDAACTAARSRSEAREREWRALAERSAAAVSAAKAQLGLFSAAGVGEARDQFWQSFAGGTAYARRATLWDALFVGMRSMGRDEPLLNFLFTMAVRLFTNLTVGIAGGVLHFFWVVVGIVRSFQPDILSAAAFLLLALLAGASFFVSAVLAMAGAGALVVSGAVASLRAVQDQQERERRRVQ